MVVHGWHIGEGQAALLPHLVCKAHGQQQRIQHEHVGVRQLACVQMGALPVRRCKARGNGSPQAVMTLMKLWTRGMHMRSTLPTKRQQHWMPPS